MIILTDRNWEYLNDMNDSVNHKIKYMSDEEQYGKQEHWTYPNDGKGDCEDYALLKRRRLELAGFDSEDLRMATCWTENGGYHAVLVVITDCGDLVLDNRYDEILSWEQLPYKWDKMQDEHREWRKIV